MCLLDGVDDAGQRGVVGGGCHPNFEGAGVVDRACENHIAHALVDRQALPRHRRLIHGAGARGDLAVERNARARLDTDDGVKGHFSGCNRQPGAVGLAHFGGVGRQVQQALDGVARSVHGTRLDQLCNGIERHHHGGFGPLADQEGAGHGHRHEGIDVQASLAQGGKALGVGRKARQPDGRCRKGHARELEHHRVGHKEGKQFRDHRQHQGQTQPPQSFGRRGVCVDVRAAGSKRLGIKAGSADSPQGLRQHGGRRMDRQGSRG